jgi:hypothetical protein
VLERHGPTEVHRMSFAPCAQPSLFPTGAAPAQYEAHAKA